MTLKPLGGGGGKTYRISDTLTTDYDDYSEIVSLWQNTLVTDQDLMEMIAASEETMRVHARTPWIIDAVVGSQTAIDAVVGSQTAIEAVVGSQTAMAIFLSTTAATDSIWTSATASKTIWDAVTPSNATKNYVDGPTGNGKGVQISPNADFEGSLHLPEINLDDANTIAFQTKLDAATESDDYAVSINETNLFQIDAGWSEQTADVSGFGGRPKIEVENTGGASGEKASIANIHLS